MNPPTSKPAPGLTLVAVPIGAARDITLHALDVLRGADVLAAEDTRSLRHLMEIHGIPLGDRPLISYHDHNGDRARPRLLQAMAEGQSVAYASEAGTPLIADPGYDLALAADGGVQELPSKRLVDVSYGDFNVNKVEVEGLIADVALRFSAAIKHLGVADGDIVT
ncbi:MAG: 16S rRNA (cytidine(1402)-2'-O)-methyltransferase, partial [Pseudooceanicola atlanticus]